MALLCLAETARFAAYSSTRRLRRAMSDLTHVILATKIPSETGSHPARWQERHRAAERMAYLLDANEQCNKNNKLTVPID